MRHYPPVLLLLVRTHHLVYQAGDRWLVLGENGSGKSAVLSALAGMGDCVSGDRAVPSQCAVVSSGFQNALIEEEIALEQGDYPAKW